MDCEVGLVIALFIVCFYVLCCKDGFKIHSGIFSGKPSIGQIATQEGFVGNEPVQMNIKASEYDPVSMGAIKQSEVDAHRRGLEERSPFATVGVAGARNVVRDDDEWTRNTGNKWSFRPPKRTVTTVVTGPKDGARQVGSVTEKDILLEHVSGSNAHFNW